MNGVVLQRTQLVVCGLFLTAMALGPSVFGSSTRGTFIAFVTVAVFAYSWNIVGGVLGELNMAHVVAWGIGSYGVVFLTTHDWPLWQALPVSLVAGAVFAGVLVLVAGALKLEGLILAIFTLVVAEVGIKVFGELPGFGEAVGIRLLIPQRFTIAQYHLVGVAVLGALMLVTYFLLRSRRGLAWQAIREDALAARSLGVDIRREKLLCYGLSGALGALGGAYQAHYLGFAMPTTSLSLPLLVVAVMCVFSGGPGTLLGPIIGVTLIQGIASLIDAFVRDPGTNLTLRLVQYVIAIVVIRLLISRGGGDDLLTVLVRRVGSSRSAGEEEPSAAADGREDGRRTPTLVAAPPVPREAAPAAPVETAPGGSAAAPSPLLVVEGLHKSFGGLRVLRGVDFTVAPGEFVALVGPNGAGKSTLNNMVAGVITPDSGSITFQGRPMGHQPPDVRFRHGISRTFQIPRLFPQLTLLQNVALACGGDDERARDALRRAGVVRVDRRAAEASLFEHRMVEVGRALAADASLILLDEPLAGLSPDQREWILRAVQEEVTPSTSVVIIEHLIPAIAPVVDRMMVLMDGVIIADGRPDVVLNDQRVVRGYLGQPIG